MSRTRLTWIVPLSLLAACSAESAPRPAATTPPFTVPTTSAPPAPAKVELVKSEWRALQTPMNAGKTTHEAACTVTITNTSSATLPVIWADIQFDSEDGKTKLGQEPAGANQLMPGQSETVTVAMWQIEPQGRPFKCRVTNIH